MSTPNPYDVKKYPMMPVEMARLHDVWDEGYAACVADIVEAKLRKRGNKDKTTAIKARR